ncbi:hypothetical protein ACIQ6K_32815 [Streptomyces sp. NPDC096354]|uniref:hypothetical protein n=1 Tax=Streptomyces sp. NPDC096354 TaxID=3366088 RepID=UPI00380FA4C3
MPGRPGAATALHHHRDIGTGRESDRLGEGRQAAADEIAATGSAGVHESVGVPR